MRPNKADSIESANTRSTPSNSDVLAPRRLGRRVINDDLGPKIPVSRDELDAIETYLEAELRELFSSKKRGAACRDT